MLRNLSKSVATVLRQKRLNGHNFPSARNFGHVTKGPKPLLDNSSRLLHKTSLNPVFSSLLNDVKQQV